MQIGDKEFDRPRIPHDLASFVSHLPTPTTIGATLRMASMPVYGLTGRRLGLFPISYGGRQTSSSMTEVDLTFANSPHFSPDALFRIRSFHPSLRLSRVRPLDEFAVLLNSIYELSAEYRSHTTKVSEAHGWESSPVEVTVGNMSFSGKIVVKEDTICGFSLSSDTADIAGASLGIPLPSVLGLIEGLEVINARSDTIESYDSEYQRLRTGK